MIYDLALLAPAALAVCFVLLYGYSQDEARKIMFSIAAVLSMLVLVGMAMLFMNSPITIQVYNPGYNTIMVNSTTGSNTIIYYPAYTQNVVYPSFAGGVSQASGLQELVTVILILLVVFVLIELIFVKPWQKKKAK